jgi:hypothetical protein
MVNKRNASRPELPDDFLGTVQAFAKTPRSPNKEAKKKARKGAAVRPKVTK